MKTKLLLFAVLMTSLSLTAQEETEIDASKPTNFYSLLDNTFENTSTPGQNVMGYRGKLMLAPNESHLILAEVPVLYNDRTQEFGLSDLRARYFYLPYKNYDKLIGAFGPSIDVFAPTGNFDKGLGSGRWTVSPGITAGIMVADWIQFFPILSYQYVSKSTFESVPAELNKSSNGITFQVMTPVVFSDKFFMQITPIFQMNDLSDSKQNRYVQEVTAVYSLAPKVQLSGYYNGNFQDNRHQVSVGMTIFL